MRIPILPNCLRTGIKFHFSLRESSSSLTLCTHRTFATSEHLLYRQFHPYLHSDIQIFAIQVSIGIKLYKNKSSVLKQDFEQFGKCLEYFDKVESFNELLNSITSYQSISSLIFNRVYTVRFVDLQCKFFSILRANSCLNEPSFV